MADLKGKGKCTFISLCSSEEEDELESEFESESEEEDDDDDDDDDDDYEEDNSISCSSGDETEEELDEEEEEDDGSESDDDDLSQTENDESVCNRVIALLKEGSQLESLTLKQCKAYLRIHGLRITGTKAVCQQRILEHWRIKDGKAEVLYPWSSFFINCTGDVCKGDVVLFTQKVYQKFDKVKRHGRLLGRRTVAGRIVKESYGKAKQQHTFTVEVLWSKGVKKLLPLFPLLVKGRNLYRLKTYRQRWADEAERRIVLAEKHRRGEAARQVKRMKETWMKRPSDGGRKHQKHLHQSRPSKKRKTTEPVSEKVNNARVEASIPKRGNMTNKHQATSQVRQVKKKQNSRVSNTSRRHRRPIPLTEVEGTAHLPYAVPVLNPYQSQTNIYFQRAPLQFAGYDMGSTSTRIRSPYIDPWTTPASQYQGFNYHNYSHQSYSKFDFWRR